MRGRRRALLAVALAAAACVERVAAPGACPVYCPSGHLTVLDTLLAMNISKDSAYRGYLLAYQAPVMLVSDTPLVDSRAIFQFSSYGPRIAIRVNDTTTGAITSLDSAQLRFYITRRDTAVHNLTVRVYGLPVPIDTLTPFAALAGPFAAAPLRQVNVDSLFARAGHKDSVKGDSLQADTVNHRLWVFLHLDSSQAHYVVADTGRLAYGVRASANAPASIALGKFDLGPQFTPYATVDSAGTPVRRTLPVRGTVVTTFVSNPPPRPLDSTLAVGGVPAARSILRVALPRGIRDSSQVIRATLILVPAVPAQGAQADSFVVEAHTVLADFGAKSPIAVDLTRVDTTVIHIGATDTTRIEITNLLQFWQSDTTQVTSLVLTAKPEAADLAEIRFYPSRAAAFRPAIRVTYVPRFPFGKP
ncbi:MAG TPA: hypothetical protein VH137_07640, partial [Gemmatimonadales bacterium]|nr:hypothetical protein [Gemmatimonadales bacterium]